MSEHSARGMTFPLASRLGGGGNTTNYLADFAVSSRTVICACGKAWFGGEGETRAAYARHRAAHRGWETRRKQRMGGGG